MIEAIGRLIAGLALLLIAAGLHGCSAPREQPSPFSRTGNEQPRPFSRGPARTRTPERVHPPA